MSRKVRKEVQTAVIEDPLACGSSTFRYIFDSETGELRAIEHVDGDKNLGLIRFNGHGRDFGVTGFKGRDKAFFHNQLRTASVMI